MTSRVVWCAACVAALFTFGVRAAVTVPAPDHAEHELLSAVNVLRDGEFTRGFHMVEQLVQREPNFRLAQLVYSELLAVRSGVKGAAPMADTSDPRVADLLAEYHARLSDAEHAPAAGAVPDDLLTLGADVHYALVVDLKRSRLYVLAHHDGHTRVLRSYYASIAREGYGKQSSGDLRTPVGIYRITGYKPGKTLPDLYGSGAFPMNYPNLWDKRHGRTGYGIWLHGVPSDTYSRPPRTSEGCVVLSNADLTALKPILDRNAFTPVILSDDLRWQPASDNSELRRRIEDDIQAWSRRWSSRDTAAYLDYYAPDFKTDDGMTRARFVAYKKRVNAAKSRIKVSVRDLSLFRYPGDPDLVLAEFTQEYRSDHYHEVSRKQQYWRRQADGHWRITLEADD